MNELEEALSRAKVVHRIGLEEWEAPSSQDDIGYAIVGDPFWGSKSGVEAILSAAQMWRRVSGGSEPLEAPGTPRERVTWVQALREVASKRDRYTYYAPELENIANELEAAQRAAEDLWACIGAKEIRDLDTETIEYCQVQHEKKWHSNE